MFNTPQKHHKTGYCLARNDKPSCDARLTEKVIGTKAPQGGSVCDSMDQSHTYYPSSTDTDERCNDVTLTTSPWHPKLDKDRNAGA